MNPSDLKADFFEVAGKSVRQLQVFGPAKVRTVADAPPATSSFGRFHAPRQGIWGVGHKGSFRSNCRLPRAVRVMSRLAPDKTWASGPPVSRPEQAHQLAAVPEQNAIVTR